MNHSKYFERNNIQELKLTMGQVFVFGELLWPVKLGKRKFWATLIISNFHINLNTSTCTILLQFGFFHIHVKIFFKLTCTTMSTNFTAASKWNNLISTGFFFKLACYNKKWKLILDHLGINMTSLGSQKNVYELIQMSDKFTIINDGVMVWLICGIP